MTAALAERGFVFADVPVHYVEGGAGLPLLMLHGSGPGASTQGNWQRVLEPLCARYHVHAMDLIGFGRSGLKPQPPYFDVDLWIGQCRAMIARMPGAAIGVIGHSLSGALALKLAALEPRIAKVMTTATMGAVFEPNDVTEAAWTFPADRDALRRAARHLVHDPSLIDEAYLDGRERVLGAAGYARYFRAMFDGDKRRFIADTALRPGELARIGADLLLVHGRDDPGFPAHALTLALARSLPRADVALLGRCSHSVAFEHPGTFLSLAFGFFGGGAR